MKRQTLICRLLFVQDTAADLQTPLPQPVLLRKTTQPQWNPRSNRLRGLGRARFRKRSCHFGVRPLHTIYHAAIWDKNPPPPKPTRIAFLTRQTNKQTGYKFETLATLPAPWGQTSREYIEGRQDEVVNNKAQYCSVVRTGIGKTIMCLGGEVDAGEQSTALFISLAHLLIRPTSPLPPSPRPSSPLLNKNRIQKKTSG